VPRDDEPTRIVPRPHHRASGTPAGGVAVAPPPPRVEIQIKSVFERPEPPPLLSSSLRPAWHGKVGWALAGAAIASALFLLLGRGASPTSAPAVAAAATPAAAPATAAAPTAALDQQMPAATLDVPAPAPAVFDRDLIARRTLAASRGCFTPARLAAGLFFRASLAFAPGDALARRSYFASTDGLTPAEHRCLDAAYVGAVHAGAPPPQHEVVQIDVRLNRDDGTATVWHQP
jgi:hypothetical protein